MRGQKDLRTAKRGSIRLKIKDKIGTNASKWSNDRFL